MMMMYVVWHDDDDVCVYGVASSSLCVYGVACRQGTYPIKATAHMHCSYDPHVSVVLHQHDDDANTHCSYPTCAVMLNGGLYLQKTPNSL